MKGVLVGICALWGVVTVCWGAAAQAPVLLGKAPGPEKLAERLRAPEGWEDEGDGEEEGRRDKGLHVVLDTPYEIWSGEGSYVRVVAYRGGFRAASGARVYVDDQQVGVTDGNGSLVFLNKPRAEEGRQQVVTAVLGEGARALVGRVGFESYQRTNSFESTEVYAYTDRGVYQPGEVIRVRALVWRLRGEFSARAGEEVELRLLDPRGALVGGERLKSDAWGVVAAQLPLAAQVEEGVYTLQVQHGGEVAEARLRVERFVAPVIRMRHDLPRYLSVDAREMPFTVHLSSLQGGRLGEGSRLHVKIAQGARVLFEQTQPWREAEEALSFAPGAEVFESLRQLVRDGGRFEVTLKATDGAGRGDELKREILWTSSPYTVVFEADKDEYAYGEEAKLQVKVVDVDQAPVSGLEVRLELEAPRRVLRAKTDGFGVALFGVKVRQEETCFEGFLQGVARALVSECVYATPTRGLVSKVQVPVVKEREEVPIEVALAPGYVAMEGVVHVDVVDSSGALVHAFDLGLREEGGRAVARGRFRAPTWGTMLLTMFVAARPKGARADRYGVGLLTEGQQVTVAPGRELKVVLDGLPAQVRPGQEVEAVIQVRDGQGRPAEASVGASVVDAAIISLRDPLEVTPMQRFYNPELKVLSTTGSKILTWPVVSRSWGEERLDVALPPFGFVEGDYREEGGGGRYAQGSMGVSAKGMGGVGSSGGGKITLESQEIGGYLMKPADALADAPAAKGAARPAVEEEEAPARRRAAAVKGPRVTLRTVGSEGALWVERLEASGGQARVRFRVPEAITEQDVAVVASDKVGGVGVGRATIKVRQGLFVRSELPASLRAGVVTEVGVSVRSLEGGRRRVKLSLEGLEVLSGQGAEVEVEAGEVASARFSVRAASPGRVEVRLKALTKGVEDVEARAVEVLPVGERVVKARRGEARAGAPFAGSVEVGPGEGALISVYFQEFGGVVEAFSGWDEEGWGFVEAPGTRAAAAGYALRVLERQGALTPARAERLRRAIWEDLSLLRGALVREGGYGWARTGRLSPYLTGRALEGLVAAREADLLVPEELIQGAVGYLLGLVDAEGIIPTEDIAWWEGAGAPRREALSAELFRVVAEAGPGAILPGGEEAFARLRGRALKTVQESGDPLALAQAGLGLRAWAARFPRAEVAWDERALVERLVKARRQGYWEPSWFNAAGGTLEATAAVLELLQGADPAVAGPLRREALGVLLANRPLLGSWRNGPGTVATMRALASLPKASGGGGGAVVIEVNGAEVARRAISASDPFADALALARVDLSPWLKAGANQVSVRCEGALAPQVTLEEVRYQAR